MAITWRGWVAFWVGFASMVWFGSADAALCPAGQHPVFDPFLGSYDTGGFCSTDRSAVEACVAALPVGSLGEAQASVESCIPAQGSWRDGPCTGYPPSGFPKTVDWHGVTGTPPDYTRYDAEFQNGWGNIYPRVTFAGCVDDPPPATCPPAGTAVTGTRVGLCVGDACEMENMCVSRPSDGIDCTARPLDIGIHDGQLQAGRWEYTGGLCDSNQTEWAEEVQPNQQSGPQGETLDCATNPNTGKSLCIDTNANCGYVNGEHVCLGQTPSSGQCVTSESGGRVCIVGESSPPAPDNGVPGQVANPDAVVMAGAGGGTTNTYNYFNSSTVQGSTNEGDGGGADGSDDNDQPGDQGEGECDPATQDCGNSGTFSGRAGTAKSFGESMTRLSQGIQATELGQAMTAIRDNVPEGSAGGCINPYFELWNRRFEFDACRWLDVYGEWLRSFAVLAWAIVAIRVFMEA